jgi:hypothetical protein
MPNKAFEYFDAAIANIFSNPLAGSYFDKMQDGDAKSACCQNEFECKYLPCNGGWLHCIKGFLIGSLLSGPSKMLQRIRQWAKLYKADSLVPLSLCGPTNS